MFVFTIITTHRTIKNSVTDVGRGVTNRCDACPPALQCCQEPARPLTLSAASPQRGRSSRIPAGLPQAL